MLNKNNKVDNKYFDIQVKNEEQINLKDNLSKDINKLVIILNYFFILMDNECFIFDINNNMNEFKIIKLDNKCIIYKVFILNEYLFLVSQKSINKYYWKKLNKLEKFNWKDEIIIYKLKQYKNYLIWRCLKLIIIIDMNNFAKILSIKINENYNCQKYFNLRKHSTFDITVFKNYLVYKELNVIKIINWDKNLFLEKEFILSVMYKNKEIYNYLYKNYLIIWEHNEKNLNIIDLENNYKNLIINDFKGNYEDINFKKINNLFFIFSEREKIIYDMNNYVYFNNIKKNNYIKSWIIIKNLIITNINNNIKISDYDNELLNLNYKDCKLFKSYNNNKIICIEDKKLEINDFKIDLKIISKNKYTFHYKNYGIDIFTSFIKIYNIEKDHNLVFEKLSVYVYDSFICNNYLIHYENKKLIVLNLDNFDDIKEKEYQYINNLLNYKDKLYILFNKHIEVLNINNFNNNKIFESENNLEGIKLYENYLFVLKEKLIIIFDLKNNKIIKNIEIDEKNIKIKIKNDYLKIKNSNYNLIYLIDIKNNFEIINVAKDDLGDNLGKELHIFNGLLIFYDKLSIHVYKKKGHIIKWTYIDTTYITSVKEYLLIEENLEVINIIIYENEKFILLKQFKINLNKSYIFEDLLYITFRDILKIYNIKNNFEEIKEITFDNYISRIKYEDNNLLIKTDDYNYKIKLNFDNSSKFIWDKISYNYYLKFENLKGELNLNLKSLKDYYNEEHNINNTILFNYILKINYSIIKNTEAPKLLKESLELFGIDRYFIELKNRFSLIDLIISSNKINIFLEILLNYYIENNHFYEINHSQFLSILEKIKDIHLFKIFIKYIFQRTEIAIEYINIKYINLNDYKIIKFDKLYFDNDNVFNNNSKNIEKKEFEIYNFPFMISDRISDNYKLFEILANSFDFVKESYFKYWIYYFFDKTIYFKYFNIVMYILWIVSMTINLVNKNFVLLIIYLICIIYFILYEIIQFYYDYKTYFKQSINLFDILLIIYNIVIFIYIYLGLFESMNLIIMPLYYLNGYKLINFLKSIDLIRKEIRLFINVIKNTTSFIFFIVIILIYFTNLNFLFNFNNFKKFNLSFFNVYGQMLGNFDDNFNEYKFYDFFELLVNTYSFNIILLNLFISVISKVFDNYNENLELYDIQEKINLLQEFSSVYFIIDYINKIIFKSIKKEKYYFFIFEKKQKEINLIEINKKLVDSEINIKTEIKTEIKKNKTEVENKVEEVKTEIKEVKTELKSEIKTEIKKVENKVEELKSEVTEIKKLLENLKK